MHIVVERIYLSHLIYLHNITWEFLADVKNIQTRLVVKKCISYIMLPRLFSNGYFLFEFKAMLGVNVYILRRNLTTAYQSTGLIVTCSVILCRLSELRVFLYRKHLTIL